MDTLSDAVENGGRLEILRALRVECTRRLLDPDTTATAAAALARRIQDLTDAIAQAATEAPPSASGEAFVDGLRLIVTSPATPGGSADGTSRVAGQAPGGTPGGVV